MMTKIAINWPWSSEETKDRFQGFWKMGEMLPDHLLNDDELKRKTRRTFEQGREEFYEPLRIFQPKTWKLLFDNQAYFVRKKTYPELVDILVSINDLAVFVSPFQTSDDLRDWKKIFLTLPEFLHGYYTNFNGMHASFSSLGPINNLPMAVGYWRRVSDYRLESKLKKNVLNCIEKELGYSDNIKIFIQTEWDDLVMLNENTIDQKVYVAPKGKFEDFFELGNAAEEIDNLCSHVISGSLEPYYMLP